MLRCASEDPRVDRVLESRGRYLGELVAMLQVPVDSLVRDLRADGGDRLGHEVLAAAAAFGHAGACELIEDRAEEVELRGVVAGWLVEWGVMMPVQLPEPIRALVLADMLDRSDCAQAFRAPPCEAEVDLRGRSVAELLDRARTAKMFEQERLQAALTQRTTEPDRVELWHVVQHDLVHGRVRAAARALGSMGDERGLPLCEQMFGREDDDAAPGGRLPGLTRMRRSAMAAYVQCLPAPLQLRLARTWHPRGGYFTIVGGTMFERHAEPDDRTYLERCVERDLCEGSGWDIISELDALGRIGDERSAELLAAVAERATYSHARRRAVHGLALLGGADGISRAALREALWDCEDETAADACAFAPDLDEDGKKRVQALSRSPAAESELRVRAARRLARR